MNKLFILKLPFLFLYGLIKSFFHRRKKMTDPIDFVVLWVDDHDEQWQQEKTKYAQMENKAVMIHNNAERYRDWGLFKYWFRAVEKYAPWVNKVYLVTCGHVPAWLNLDNPKLVHVKHEDFIPKEYLPTFNCNPIETNLHRIPGLSEHFVYFNDDMILTKPVSPEDFFQEGKPLVCSAANPVVCGPENDAFSLILFSVTGLMNRFFGDYIPMKRHYYGVVYPMLSKSYEKCSNDIRMQRYRMTCINDASDINVENFETLRNNIAAAFEEILHTNCSFEK